MYEYGVSFKSVRHLQEYGSFLFYSRYVIVFKQWREVLGAHGLSGHSAKCRNPILHGVSPVSQNLYVESLNQFYIFLARKYASFGHSAFFRNHYGKLSHLRAKYSKSPKKNLSIFTVRQHKFSPNVLIWSKYLGIIETTGWYLSIDTCFVLVHCYVGMLMTSCLWGTAPILGCKRIRLLQPDVQTLSILYLANEPMHISHLYADFCKYNNIYVQVFLLELNLIKFCHHVKFIFHYYSRKGNNIKELL